MLTQNFKTADELEITEPQFDALRKTLVLLETGKLVHVPSSSDGDARAHFTGHFNMCNWSAKHDCGTIACIGGTAELIGNVSFGHIYNHPDENLKDLFLPPFSGAKWSAITPTQAATALRSYLTTGDAKWHEAVA